MKKQDKKVVSFDLWGTLIKANPHFSVARATLLAGHCNQSVEYIKYKISCVKEDFLAVIERYGVHIAPAEIHRVIFEELGINDVYERGLLRLQTEQLFLEYQPTPYDSDTCRVLAELAKEYKLILISNTLLSNGFSLLNCTELKDIYCHFDRFLFSDQEGADKPNRYIFDKAFNKVNKDRVLAHVGDNYNTDGIGADRVGITWIPLNDCKVMSKGYSIKDVPRLLNHIYAQRLTQ